MLILIYGIPCPFQQAAVLALQCMNLQPVGCPRDHFFAVSKAKVDLFSARTSFALVLAEAGCCGHAVAHGMTISYGIRILITGL